MHTLHLSIITNKIFLFSNVEHLNGAMKIQRITISRIAIFTKIHSVESPFLTKIHAVECLFLPNICAVKSPYET